MRKKGRETKKEVIKDIEKEEEGEFAKVGERGDWSCFQHNLCYTFSCIPADLATWAKKPTGQTLG